MLESNIDAISISFYKLHGPNRIGAVVCNNNIY